MIDTEASNQLAAKIAIIKVLRREHLCVRIRLACGGLSWIDRIQLYAHGASLAAWANQVATTPAAHCKQIQSS